MLRGRLQLSDATISVIGIRKADLARLLDGRPCYTQLKAPACGGDGGAAWGRFARGDRADA